LRIVERDRERADASATRLRSERGDGAGIDPAREEDADRNVADQMLTRRSLELDAERLEILDVGSLRRGQGPVGHWRWKSPIEADLGEVSGREGAHIRHGSLIAVDESVPGVSRQGLRRQPPLHGSRCEESAHLGGEQDRRAAFGIHGARVVQRLDPDAIARDDEDAPSRVPQGKGEHPPQALHAVGAPDPVGAEEDFRVGPRVESLPHPAEFVSKLLESVDLPVEDQHAAGQLVVHRLIRFAAQVDDREAPVREHDSTISLSKRGTPRRAGIGSAVDLGGAHALDGGINGRVEMADRGS
jgi:hypothetical protein